MAEFDKGTANLGLFHQIFHRHSQNESQSADTGSIQQNVNNASSRNMSKTHSHDKTSLILNSQVDCSIMTQTNLVGDLGEESSLENVLLNNIANLEIENNSGGVIINESNANSFHDVGGAGSDVVTSAVNGISSAMHISSGKTCAKKKKGVSFPKDTLLSSYVEPPDPWKNAPSRVTEELISSYKKSCDIHGSKPLVKLLQQLQVFNSSEKLEELLSLKGEKLDQKQCECIEEILKRVQFKMLDLEASNLDDECAVAFFDMIEFYESACQLNIAFNKNIQARGWQACSRLVRRTPNLTYLDMRGCDLNERTIPIFGRALKLGCHLTILHMESMNLSGRPLLILVAALKTNETLQELFLAENKLMPTDGVQLGNLLRYNHKLSLLDLRNNHLQDVGTGYLCDGLMEQPRGEGLRTLVLWNNSINYQAMSTLGKALAKSQNMETLNIGHNNITNEGIHLLKDGLLRMTSLLRLGLQGTKISDEGAVALAEYIAESKVLLRIDLRDNDIKTGGLMALSHAMRMNTSVTRIDLDREPKKETSMKDFAEQQANLMRDIITFQQRNAQIAIDKEEQERERLQKKAEVDLAAAKQEVKTEQPTSLPANDSTESFTLIEEALIEDVEEDNNKDEESVIRNITKEREKEDKICSQNSDINEVSAALVKNEAPHQRPNVLFSCPILTPQVSLDSPFPTPSDSLHKTDSSKLSSESVSQPETAIPFPASNSTPGDMILSPQYFPKQIARKLFSVSSVNEEPVDHQFAISQPISLLKSCDPLGVSLMPLIPVPSSPELSTLPSSSAIVQHCAEGASCSSPAPQISGPAPQISSPNSLLFEDLAEESMKHMLSPDIDVKIVNVMGDSLAPDSPQQVFTDDSSNHSNKNVVSSHSQSVPETSCDISELLSIIDVSASDVVLPVSHNDVDICDKLHSAVIESSGSRVSVSLSDENLNAENLADEGISVVRTDHAQESKEPLQQSSVMLENNPLKLHMMEMSATTSQECKQTSQDGGVGNIRRECFSDNKASEEALEGDIFGNIVKHDISRQRHQMTNDFPVFSTENDADSNLACSQTETAATLFVGAHLNGCAEDSETVHKQENIFDSSEVFFGNKADFGSQKITPSLTDFTHHPTVNGDDTEFPALGFHDTSAAGQKSLSNGNNSSDSSIFGLPHCKTRHSFDGSQQNSTFTPLTKDSTAETTNGISGNPADVNNVVSNNLDIESVDFSLDEEPWLAVGVDGSDLGASKKSLKQPDFFTTLTMNGLTQELASALTSLDGSSSQFEGEEYDLGLQPHDEFEKELDNMLVLVQNDLPWPLKG